MEKSHSIPIHKKGRTNNPGNFRPIIFGKVAVKISTSALRNKACEFLSSNNYTETNIQKVFVNGISVTFEYTSHLVNII